MPRRALSNLALSARGIAEGMALCTGPVVLLATPTQGFSGTAGPSSLRASETSHLSLRRHIAGIICAVLIKYHVGQCVSAVTSAVAGDYSE
jgi:hypothetical protein